MYLDARRHRLLRRDGVSLMTVEGYAAALLEGQAVPSARIDDEHEALAYAQLYDKDIFYWDDDYVDPIPDHSTYSVTPEGIIDVLSTCPRNGLALERHGDAYLSRLEVELAYFERTDNLVMLRRCYDLIQNFKQKNVVWGIGRGSACASMLLFVFEVHDVDSLRWGIPFAELSKETSRYEHEDDAAAE